MGEQNIGEALRRASLFLSQKGLSQPRRDAEQILTVLLDRPLTFLVSHPETPLTDQQLHAFDELVRRRGEHYPLQYLRGYQEFYGRDFRVTPSVLIPRPETEILIETALRLLESRRQPRVLDIGTGSGCIAVTLACERPDLELVATDISSGALELARENARRLGPARQISFKLGALFEPVAGESFDLVISNPPYVADNDSQVEQQVSRWEPAEAVFAGPTGLEVITALLHEIPDYLVSDGRLIIEIGHGQADKLSRLGEVSGMLCCETVSDLAGVTRVAVFRRNGNGGHSKHSFN